MTTRPDITRGQIVAKKLQKMMPEYSIHVTDHPDVSTDALAGARFEKFPFRPWREQLQYIADVALVINTDYTQTRGRVQMDCAAVGTPSVGADSDGQRDVFPDLYADSNTSVDALVEQARKILNSPEDYTQIVSMAKTKLETYTYQHCADRLLQAIST